MDEVNAFLNITGPWGVVGILLFVLYWYLKREDKSIRESLGMQIQCLDSLSKALDRLSSTIEQVDDRTRDLLEKQNRECDALQLLNTQLLQRQTDAPQHPRGLLYLERRSPHPFLILFHNVRPIAIDLPSP